MSLQITVVAPSVSTAGKWRISALRRAMRCVAMASDSVTVGSRPSGTLATMMPMANIRLAQNGSPRKNPIRKNATPSAVAKIATNRDSRAISSCRCEVDLSAVWVRWAILPNSVCMPVAKTMARPSPDTNEVPASSTFFVSSGDF